MISLRVGGLTPLTTIDYPDHLAAVVFCQGCPWRCRYCHNAHLQPQSQGSWSWEGVIQFLRSRMGLLEAVVFSGGEPTMQPALQHCVRQAREMGFLVGLHTAGIFPDRLAALLPDLDWIGFDVKAPLDSRYDLVTGHRNSADSVRASLRLLRDYPVPVQIRSTLDQELLDQEACRDLQAELAAMNLPATIWQECRPTRRQAVT